PDRHQARARLLDHEPDRLHVPRGRHRGLYRGLLPPPLPRVLQGPPLHGGGQRDPRDARRAGHAQIRWPVPATAATVVVVPHRLAVPGGRDSFRRFLLQGTDPWRRLLETDASLALAVWVFGFITALVTGFYTGRM